jgi:hypothetical protein
MMSRTFAVLIPILILLSAASGSYAQQLGPSFWKNECETPWGSIIQGGQSVTAYQYATGSPCGGCVSETRSCAGSYLDGSYTNQSCTPVTGFCVFVTSTTYNGSLGGQSGADAKCAARAAAAGFSGSYRAWIATTASDDPESQFAHSSSPYYLPSGTKVADNWTDLTDGSLDSAISETETGSPPGTAVWTAVGTNGTYAGSNSCTSWGSTSGSGNKGSPSSATSTWTSNGTQSCSSSAALYCFKQPITIFLSSGSSWTVPADWNSSDNTIEAIGAGGDGTYDAYWGNAYSGGGGAYAKVTNLSLTPGGSVSYRIGAHGGSTGSGTSPTANTWFKDGSTLVAAGGATDGNGGTTGNSVGSTKYAGGNPGAGCSWTDGYGNYWNPGGAGGAAGLHGAGNNGGPADCAIFILPGNGGSGDAGYGGSGDGGNGTEWDASHGSGGGGNCNSNPNGGLYGGGACASSGANGLIVITYTP